MKVLIIGGSGLISTAITRQLLENNVDVTLYNRGISSLRINGKVSRVIGDRKNSDSFIKQAKKLGNFDCVIDMVCFTPEDAKASIDAFIGSVKQYIFCSTVDVYGDLTEPYPVSENAMRKPLSEYGKNKARCEDIFLEAYRTQQFPVTILRPAHAYGEGGPIISTLGARATYVDRIRKHKPIVVHGDGTTLWVSCHVDDVARAFIGALANQKALGRVYNVTGEERISWNNYHNLIAQSLYAPAPILVHLPSDLLSLLVPEFADILLNSFQYNHVFSNAAAHEDLNFHYAIPFVEGIQRTVTWLEENQCVENSDLDPFDDLLIDAWRQLSKGIVEKIKTYRK